MFFADRHSRKGEPILFFDELVELPLAKCLNLFEASVNARTGTTGAKGRVIKSTIKLTLDLLIFLWRRDHF